MEALCKDEQELMQGLSVSKGERTSDARALTADDERRGEVGGSPGSARSGGFIRVI
jgi:hypothetical protein